MENVRSIGQLFEGYEFIKPHNPCRRSERGDLIDYFVYKVNKGRDKVLNWRGKPFAQVSPTYMAMVLAPFTLRDLYYIKSCAEDYENRGKPWGKYFWGVIKTEKSPQ